MAQKTVAKGKGKAKAPEAAKKPAGKKASTADAIAADLEADVAAMESEFAEKAPEAEGAKKPAGKKAPEASSLPDLMGAKVRFRNEAGDALEGVVVKQQPSGDITIEDSECFWESKVADVEVVSSGKKVSAPTNGVDAPPRDERLTEVRIVALKDLTIPKLLVRDWVDDDKFKRFTQNIKDHGLRDPIDVDSFEGLKLCDGLQRYKAAEALGMAEVPVRVAQGIKTDSDRLWHGLTSNESRREMHWTDLGRTFAALVEDGDYTQRKIAKAFGVTDAYVSRLIAATVGEHKLPKDLQEAARDPEVSARVSPGALLELTTAPKKVVEEVREAIKKGKNVTIADVRIRTKELTKQQDAEAKAAGVEARTPEKRGGARPRQEQTSNNYRDLSVEDVGTEVHVRVTREGLELRFKVPHDGKTYRNFEYLKEITRALKAHHDEAFSREGARVKSFDALVRQLSVVRAEIG